MAELKSVQTSMIREHDPCAMRANFTVHINGARTQKCRVLCGGVHRS